jgi:hypothetical protein
MRKHLNKRPSPAMGVALIALFIALGGTTYAATGGNFILGNPNSATSQTSLSAPIAGKALQVTNMSTGAGASALGLSVAAGKSPFTVNSGTKVTNLNADRLDSLDSTSLLRKGVLQSAAVTTAGGVLDVLNTGTTNGVQGKTSSPSASGVYGENTGGGFGVAGRATGANPAVLGDNTGGGGGAGVVGTSVSGFGGVFDSAHVTGPLQVDGRIVAGRIQSSQWNVTPGVGKNGPLPVSWAFNSSGGTLMVFASGTAFRNASAPIPILCLAVWIDNNTANTQFNCMFANEVEHLAFPTFPMIFSGVGAGAHTLHVDYGSGTPGTMLTDSNDVYHGVVEELPF